MSQWCDKCVYKGTDFKEWPCFYCDTDIRGKKRPSCFKERIKNNEDKEMKNYKINTCYLLPVTVKGTTLISEAISAEFNTGFDVPCSTNTVVIADFPNVLLTEKDIIDKYKEEQNKSIEAIEETEPIIEGQFYKKIIRCGFCKQELIREVWDKERSLGSETILRNNLNPSYCPCCGSQIIYCSK